MASCIQVSASRTLCNAHQILIHRNYDLLKSLACKTYVLNPPGNVSIIFRYYICSANLKVQDSHKKSIPLVSVTCAPFKLNKYDFTPKSLENPNSRLTFQKSQTLLIDKQKLEHIKVIIKSTQGDQAKAQDLDPSNKSTPEQIERVATVLKADLPNLFTKHQDYRIYHRNLEFENHLRSTRTITLEAYIRQLALLKIIGHLRYAYVEFQVLKMTTHHSEGTIKVRWRIKGIGSLKVFAYFWKYKVWNLKDTAMKDCEPWYDGFSIFYVKGDGLVHKHVVLKMQPDEDCEVDAIKQDITAKVA